MTLDVQVDPHKHLPIFLSSHCW